VWCNDCGDREVFIVGDLVDVAASAIVEIYTGARNGLVITVVEEYNCGWIGSFERYFVINNNAMGFFNVGGHNIYVDTRVSSQALLQLRRIFEIEATRVIIIPHSNL